MRTLKQNLRTVLKNSLPSATKVAVLGIGSDLRADDAAGMTAAEELRKLLLKTKKHLTSKIFFGGTAPENLTGELKRFKPSHIIMIDSVDISGRPGSVFAFRPDDVGQGVAFSTHKMPARVLVDYLQNSFPCDVTIVGIQPKTIEFGKPMTAGVVKAAKNTAKLIHGFLKR